MCLKSLFLPLAPMRSHLVHIKVLLLRLGIVLLLFTVCRILFYLLNISYFSGAGFRPFVGGLRFDLAAIFMINIPFILLSILPFNVHHMKWHRISLKLLFHLVNGVAYVLNCVDIEYYRFTLKRSTADLFTLMGGGGEDLSRLIPSLLADFWYVLLIVVALIVLAEWLYRKVKITIPATKNFKDILIRTGVLVAVVVATVFISRGGFQLRPINIINASNYATADNIPLVLNTPFTIIKTLGKSSLEPVEYFESEQLAQIYTPVKHYPDSTFKPLNVTIIIMESFSAEYMGCITGDKSYTPFLDSLSQHGFLFTNAYANGKKSIEGIPAVVSGIPTLMNDPYISSPYSGNQLASIASLLANEGYTTSFYHGAKNGTMGFDGFTELTGFDSYYGRDEYGNDDHHDGTWGIFDEEYLQYWANGLDNEETPFVSVFFSLTSHHPYPLPKRYEGVFPKGDIPIQEIVGYSDYSLQRFFRTASTMPWYGNTLFVICADHTSAAYANEYRTSLGTFRIPILFYTPSGSLIGKSNQVAQQIDIMPTVLSYLNYNEPFVGFGNNLFDNNPDFSVTYLNDVYQLTTDEYMLQFDGEKAIALYAYHDDVLLKNNLLESKAQVADELTRTIKAYIQQYNNRMIENRLTE